MSIVEYEQHREGRTLEDVQAWGKKGSQDGNA